MPVTVSVTSHTSTDGSSVLAVTALVPNGTYFPIITTAFQIGTDNTVFIGIAVGVPIGIVSLGVILSLVFAKQIWPHRQQTKAAFSKMFGIRENWASTGV